MSFFKRIFFFLLLNFLVCATISLILTLFNIRPFLTHYGINYGSLMAFCLIWGMGGALISLALSRTMARWMMGVKIIDPETRDPTQREILELVRELAHDAGLPMPQVGIFSSPEANAFATGPTKNRALVAVSSGLLHHMKTNEVKGVLGHELSHIANGDMVTMTLLQGVVNAFVMFLARVLAFACSGLGRSRENRSENSGYGSYILFLYLFEFAFMILGSMLVARFSRWREFRADAGGAHLAGKDSMISALKALGSLHNLRDQRFSKPAYQALAISTQGKRGLLSLFSTHPPLEERIERLQRS